MRTCIQKGIHIRRMEATSFESPPVPCRDVAGNAPVDDGLPSGCA